MVLSDCVCPGHELRLECTYMSGIATLWRGNAFDCPELNNEILLQHYSFESEKSCNNGTIIGRNINATYDGDGNGYGYKYISQLIIQLDENDTLEGRTVECAYSETEYESSIGTYVISYTRGKFTIL